MSDSNYVPRLGGQESSVSSSKYFDLPLPTTVVAKESWRTVPEGTMGLDGGFLPSSEMRDGEASWVGDATVALSA